MEKETSLSEWITYIEERKAYFIRDKAVRKAVRRLKEAIMDAYHKKQNPFFIVDEIFGEKLI